MKILTPFLVFLLSGSVNANSASERVKTALTNYISEFGKNERATVFLAEELTDSDFYRAYWAEECSLIYFPKEFHDEAVDSLWLVTRTSLEYPTDVREEGNKELATSNYLVSFDWYRQKLSYVVTSGEILHLTKTKHNQAAHTTPASAPR